MDDEDHSKVYLKEIYEHDYELSALLFKTGKRLEMLSHGWIKLRHDRNLKYNYVEINP